MVGPTGDFELYSPGDSVPMRGEYQVVDTQGNDMDYDLLTLDEAEDFPRLRGSNLRFRLFRSLDQTGYEQTIPITDLA